VRSSINSRALRPESGVIRREFGGCQKTRRHIKIVAGGYCDLLSIRSGVRIPSGSPHLSRLIQKFGTRNSRSIHRLCWIVLEYAPFIARNSEGIRRVTLNSARLSDGAINLSFSRLPYDESSCVRADSSRKGSARRQTDGLGLRSKPRQADQWPLRRHSHFSQSQTQRGQHG
jgi:hypothetical protein